MRRLLLPFSLTALLLMTVMPVQTAAKSYGKNQKYCFLAKGGFTYSGVSGINDLGVIDAGSYSGFNAGIGFKLELPLAFAIQPEVLYYESGTKVDVNPDAGVTSRAKLYNGNIYVPINLQWGPRLGAFRAYAQLSPFIGFALSNRMKYTDPDDGLDTVKILTGDTNIFMGGVGVGLGVEIWKFQLSAKYNWNLNKLLKSSGDTPEYLRKHLQDARMRGLEITLGFMF